MIAILISMRPAMLRQVLSGDLLPRLLGHNAYKRMSAMLKPITNYGFPHSLTTRVKTSFPVASRWPVTAVQGRLSNWRYTRTRVLIKKRKVESSSFCTLEKIGKYLIDHIKLSHAPFREIKQVLAPAISVIFIFSKAHSPLFFPRKITFTDEGSCIVYSRAIGVRRLVFAFKLPFAS